jgi:hypothetical protein
VRFPVFVRDDLSLVPEKRPIQGLSKYQSSPNEKFNHRPSLFRRIRDRKITAVLQGLDLGHATIDVQFCARDIAGLIGGEE